MKAELKINILLSIINEASNEIRILKDNVSKYATLITISSFGITSFLLKEIKYVPFFKYLLLFVFIDISFIILLWVILYKLRKDLMFSRNSIELHEKQLSTICGIARKIEGEDGTQYFEFNPYGSFDTQKTKTSITGKYKRLYADNKKIKPDFNENGMFLLGRAATCIMMLKPIILFMIL